MNQKLHTGISLLLALLCTAQASAAPVSQTISNTTSAAQAIAEAEIRLNSPISSPQLFGSGGGSCASESSVPSLTQEASRTTSSTSPTKSQLSKSVKKPVDPPVINPPGDCKDGVLLPGKTYQFRYQVSVFAWPSTRGDDGSCSCGEIPVGTKPSVGWVNTTVPACVYGSPMAWCTWFAAKNSRPPGCLDANNNPTDECQMVDVVCKNYVNEDPATTGAKDCKFCFRFCEAL